MSFDPYHVWLGIAPHERPINHYRLLGLTLFEDDEEAILAAADRLMGHVRTFQSGRRASASQQILNELSTAKTCLLNPHTKATYDAVLHGQLAAAPPWSRSGDLLEPPAWGTPPGVPEPPTPPTKPQAAAVNPSSEETWTGHQTYPTPFYFQPWFPVLVFAGVAFMVLGLWGIGTMIGRANKQAAQTPVAVTTQTSEVNEMIAPPEDDAPPDDAVLIMQEAGGEVHFTAATAVLEGSPQLIVRDATSLITGITSADDVLTWHFRIEHPAAFRIEATYATETGAAGGEFVVTVDDEPTKPITTRDTGGATTFTSERVGFLWIRRSGRHRLTLAPTKIPTAGSLMILRSLRLIPVRGTAAP